MALVTYQMQGSYVTLPSRPLPWTKGIKLKRCVACNVTGRTDRSLLLKWNVGLSVGPSCIRRQKPKALRILAFKGVSQNDESGGRTSGPKPSKNSVRLKNDGPIIESPNGNDISLSYASEANESVTSSTAIHRLFKKWLTNLRTPPAGEVVDGILEEESSHDENSETVIGVERMERNMDLKTVLSHFLALDATIKIPVVIFVPLFLAVNVVYGAEVSKDLAPLWIVGPVIVALYVKMFQWLAALYVYTFKVSVKAFMNLPSFLGLVYVYLFKGKLKELLYSYFVKPSADTNDEEKQTGFQAWAKERYLDFVEWNWPFFFKLIRALKSARLI